MILGRFIYWHNIMIHRRKIPILRRFRISRFHVDSAAWLSPETRAAIREHLDLTRDGWLVVKSDRTESRTLNMADALEKLRVNIRKAENPVTETFKLKEDEMARKAKLKAARERLHIKQQ